MTDVIEELVPEALFKNDIGIYKNNSLEDIKDIINIEKLYWNE